jgi:GTP-binding protein
VLRGEAGQVLADLAEGEECLLLKGGRGGKGNHFFKSSVNQAPEHSQPGEAGETLLVHLELKLLADIGIIGFPNAGKSTLISRISAARPKISNYPFTTLVPNLGVVKYGQDKSFVVADIPGLIAEAHKGVGLGAQFLRHIERTRAFVHLIDVSEMALQQPYQSYLDINHELKQYDLDHEGQEGYVPLTQRPQIVVFNKIDSVSTPRVQEFENTFLEHGTKVIKVSAATGQGIQNLVYAMGDMVFREGKEDE